MLMRWDPFRELDRLTEQLTARPTLRQFPMDAYRRGDQFFVLFDLPGVDPSAIELTVERNVLTVKAERQWQPADGDEVLVAERPRGSFSRQLFLGDTLDGDQVEATYDEGVLTLTIPVAERAKARRVEVASGGSSTAIDAAHTAA